MRQGSSCSGPGRTGWWLDQGSSGDGEKQMVLRLSVFQIGTLDVVTGAQTVRLDNLALDLPLSTCPKHGKSLN